MGRVDQAAYSATTSINSGLIISSNIAPSEHCISVEFGCDVLAIRIGHEYRLVAVVCLIYLQWLAYLGTSRGLEVH